MGQLAQKKSSEVVIIDPEIIDFDWKSRVIC